MIWAAILADTLRHAALALSTNSSSDFKEIAQRIMTNFLIEMDLAIAELDTWPVFKQ